MSVVPPPTSTTSTPCGAEMSIPAPMAAATGSSIRQILRIPAALTASTTARFSTSVILQGTLTTTRGITTRPALIFLRYTEIRYRARSKSEITPPESGWETRIRAEVRPTMAYASLPVATTAFVSAFTATTAGSFRTIPFPSR